MSYSGAYYQIWRSRSAQDQVRGAGALDDVVMGVVVNSRGSQGELLQGLSLTQERYNQIQQAQQAEADARRATALQSMMRR